MVAGRVFAVLDVEGVVGHLLHAAAHEPAVALLRRHALDLGLLRIEVVGDRVHLVGGPAVGKLGFRYRPHAVHRVGLSIGMDQLRVHVDAHVVGLEVAALIGYVALVVDVYQLVAYVVDQRIRTLSVERIVEELLGRARLAHRIAPHGIRCRGIGLRSPEERVGRRAGEGIRGGTRPCLLASVALLLTSLAPRDGLLAGGFDDDGLRIEKLPDKGVGTGCGEGVGRVLRPGNEPCSHPRQRLGEEQNRHRRQEIF